MPAKLVREDWGEWQRSFAPVVCRRCGSPWELRYERETETFACSNELTCGKKARP